METVPDPQGLKRRDLFKLCFGCVAALFIPRPKVPVKELETVNLGFQPGYIVNGSGPAGPGWNEFYPHTIWDPGHIVIQGNTGGLTDCTCSRGPRNAGLTPFEDFRRNQHKG